MKDLELARHIYDQLIPLGPILLALSASSPLFKGKVADIDCRFNVISMVCDDRTESEKEISSSDFIYKSRYAPVYSYISDSIFVKDYHNDHPKMPICDKIYNSLTSQGIPERLAEHYSNLLVRDPLVLFENNIDVDNTKENSHFEVFQSTNWNSLRFKPPNKNINDNTYKIEVRPCDIMITPYENAALASVIVLYIKACSMFNINHIIPISMNDINFERAHTKSACSKEKFYWNIGGIDEKYTQADYDSSDGHYPSKETFYKYHEMKKEEEQEHWKELTLFEILEGSKEHNYKGLFTIIADVVNILFENDLKAHEKVMGYLNFLKLRASGKLMTDAEYIRNFVLSHPLYNKDSRVSEEINYDLCKELVEIQSGKKTPSELFEKAI